MKFSESWLREWVNPEIDSNALVEQITMAGLEVDGVTPVAESFTKVVVGQVVECGPHPDADKLQVTKVNVGEEELLDIVCGAKNCRKGLKVAVATVGAVLPGDFKIKKAKLRGQPSCGMLCSESELGMAEEKSPGIMELPHDAAIGTCLRDYLSLDDVTIDVDLTANRGDCLGMKGLAREVGVLNSLSVCEPEITAVVPSIDDFFPIHIEAGEACPRYCGRVIKGINLDVKTPLWMVEKLRRSGIRSIDPVVDITNYVLLEQGHPMHAFDLAKLEDGIVVRYAKEDEKLVLLDGNEATLRSDTLVIADEKKALAIAGIFGGEGSGVTAQSQDIFLESAFFTPNLIMGKARTYGLHTDASHRYERGVDPELQVAAMERATQLLIDICGGEAGPIVTAESEAHLPKPVTVGLRAERITRMIGIEIERAQVEEILIRLGLKVSADGDDWQVEVPTYRFDIKIEVDLIEEIARVYGYNNIPNLPPLAHLNMAKRKESDINVAKFRNLLVDRGFTEAITYSFVDPKVQKALYPQQQGLALPHPISADMSVMRLSLLPGLLAAVVHNQNRQQPRVRIFEQGLSFVPDDNCDLGIRQETMLAGVICGSLMGEHWSEEDRNVDFYDIKGDVEAILALSCQQSIFSFEVAENSALHPGQSAQVMCNGKPVGYVGAVHPRCQKALGLNGRTFVFELNLAAISQAKIPQACDISKFPANRRDLAIVVEQHVPAGKIISFIEKVGVNQLVDLKLFDVYQGKGIEPGYKSLAISLTLQDTQRTLEDKDIAEAVQTIVEALAKEFNASLRE
jgi:phenylalanyl-tRNA synthetase beta chain